MDPAAYTQIATIVVVVLAIIWHQQRGNDKLRTEFRAEIAQVRAEIGEIRTEVAQLGRRVARIEGALGIPAQAAPVAVGAPAQPEAAGSTG